MLQFRRLEARDLNELKLLHEDWFPVKYSNTFYENAAKGYWNNATHPLYTLIAETTCTDEDEFKRLITEEFHRIKQPKEILPTYTIQIDRTHQYKKWRICGALTSQFVNIRDIEEKNLFENETNYQWAMYILTIGTSREYRRHQLGKLLLQYCIEEAKKCSTCGGVYLHVKVDNIPGVRFYERHGFLQIQYLKDYYIIKDIRYDAYLYMYYINGARRYVPRIEHESTKEKPPKPVWTVMLTITYVLNRWYQLLHGIFNSKPRDLHEAVIEHV